jgi:hypothetical protein
VRNANVQIVPVRDESAVDDDPVDGDAS